MKKENQRGTSSSRLTGRTSVKRLLTWRQCDVLSIRIIPRRGFFVALGRQDGDGRICKSADSDGNNLCRRWRRVCQQTGDSNCCNDVDVNNCDSVRWHCWCSWSVALAILAQISDLLMPFVRPHFCRLLMAFICLVCLWSPYVVGQTIIFLPCGFHLSSSFLFFFFSSPNLNGRRLDVYHTSTHGVALVRI